MFGCFVSYRNWSSNTVFCLRKLCTIESRFSLDFEKMRCIVLTVPRSRVERFLLDYDKCKALLFNLVVIICLSFNRHGRYAKIYLTDSPYCSKVVWFYWPPWLWRMRMTQQQIKITKPEKLYTAYSQCRLFQKDFLEAKLKVKWLERSRERQTNITNFRPPVPVSFLKFSQSC